MTYTIPFSVENEPCECVVEILDLSQRDTIAEIFRSVCEPGTHAVELDPASINGGLDAGVYIVRLTIGESRESYPLQYMP